MQRCNQARLQSGIDTHKSRKLIVREAIVAVAVEVSLQLHNLEHR